METLVKMKLYGYTVEKEKRYLVKIKGEIEENLLVYGLGIDRYFFARTYDSSKRNGHTKTIMSLKHDVMLKKKAVGYVFDALSEEYISLTFDDKKRT